MKRVGLLVVSVFLGCGSGSRDEQVGTTSTNNDEEADQALTQDSVPQNLYWVSPCADPCATSMDQPAKKGGTVYRGARPGQDAVRYLRDELGVRTIVDLEIMPYNTGPEDSHVATANKDPGAPEMNIVHYHMEAIFEPGDDDIDRILAVLKQAEEKQEAAYVHCALGRDRTGLIIALHRVLNDGWKAQDAYEEWYQHGFDQSWFTRWEFTPLFDYFVERAGPVKRH
jgi:hypothetical protein